MVSFVFLRPFYLIFLISIPLIIWSHFVSLTLVKGRALRFANFEALENLPINKLISKKYFLLFFKILIISFLVFSVAGTKMIYNGSGGSNFVLAIDTSSSMSIQDYSPNRLEAAKKSAIVFLDKIAGGSMVGVLSFSGSSFIESKLTQDKFLLKEKINDLSISRTGGTDVGGAIINSVNLLIMEEGSLKNLILITDGQSNVGSSIDESISYANENGVSVYPIGIGTSEGGNFEDTDAVLKLDSDTLQKIADETDGKYYQVDNVQQLESVYIELAGINSGKVEMPLDTYFLIIVLVLLMLIWGILTPWFRISP